VSPAELMAMTSLMTQTVRELSVGMKAAVTELVAEGWTEEQSKALVIALMTNSLRGTATEPEAEGSAA